MRGVKTAKYLNQCTREACKECAVKHENFLLAIQRYEEPAPPLPDSRESERRSLRFDAEAAVWSRGLRISGSEPNGRLELQVTAKAGGPLSDVPDDASASERNVVFEHKVSWKILHDRLGDLRGLVVRISVRVTCCTSFSPPLPTHLLCARDPSFASSEKF